MKPTLTAPLVHEALSTLLKELVHGASEKICWVLNRNDAGLLASLDRISASAASAPSPTGGASIAAHADHLRYSYSLLNRWAAGENPFGDANYSAAWERGTVTEAEWTERRVELRRELEQAERVVAKPVELGKMELTGMIAGVVHLAYHVGAVRQINQGTHGPRAND